MDSRETGVGRAPRASVVGVGLILIFFGIFAAGMGAVGALQRMHDPFNACEVSALEPGSVPFEGQVVDWDHQWFPIGLRCAWSIDDGSIRWTSLTPDWPATAVAYGGVVLIFGGLGALALEARRRDL